MFRSWNRKLSPSAPAAKRRPRRAVFTPTLEALEERCLLSKSIPLSTDTWTPIGPAPITNSFLPGAGATSGRITDLVADPSDPTGNTILITAAGGGLWKTTNANSPNVHWTPLTDSVIDPTSNQPVPIFSGSVAIVPSNPNIIYVGTGESNNAGDSYYGEGVLKTTDGGKTWTLLKGDMIKYKDQFDRREISKVVIDPSDPTGNTVYVALTNEAVNGLVGNSGIYKTTDGGTTWVDMTTGQIPGGSQFDDFTDLVMDPTNPRHLYAAIGTAFPFSQPSDNGVYETLNGGLTWRASGDFPIGGFDEGRIALAISRSNPTVLYAAITSTLTSGLSEMLKTTNGGKYWSSVTVSPPDYQAGQGWYDTTLAIDPSNPNIVYAGGSGVSDPLNTTEGSAIVATFDGGRTWKDLSNVNVPGLTALGPHPDNHGIGFDPRGRLLVGTDGGLYRLDNPPTVGWTDLNGDLNTIQFTGIALDPTDPNIAYGGSQDNGTEKFTDNQGWTAIAPGDGGFVRVDQDNPQTIYHTFFGPNLFRSDDAGKTWTDISAGLAGNFSNFYMPYVLDPTDGARVIAGTDFLNESNDEGKTWNVIGRPGGFFGFNPGDAPVDAIAISPSSPRTIYASAGGGIFITTNDGQTWRDVTPFGFPAGRFSDLIVDPTDDRVAYATRGEFTNTQTGPFDDVIMTTDGGLSWQTISGNLPDVPTWSVAVDTRTPVHTLYIGTDTGVYSSTDMGQTWAPYKTGLANAQVVSLELNPSLNILAAGTHGRGMWEIDLSAHVSGELFNDLNGDGKQEVGEPGLAGWTVQLGNTSGIVVATVTTDNSGNYSFTGLQPGRYSLSVVTPAGWFQTTPTPPLPVLGIGGSATGKNIGFFQRFSIGGKVFADTNGNGLLDTGESGLANWTVQLLNASNQIIGTLTTPANGSYNFGNLGPGSYTVREVTQSGYVQTSPASVVVAGTSGNTTVVNFGNFAVASISGRLFDDHNVNGVLDAGEPALQGWTVQLLNTSNTVLAVAVTDINGTYQFLGVGPGTYRVREVVQTNWVQTSANPADIVAPFGGSVAGVNFGDFHQITISGQVFSDFNGNGTLDSGEPGLPGWQVELENPSGQILQTTTTGAGGSYRFSVQASGTYRVREVVQTGWVQTSSNPPDTPAAEGTTLVAANIGNFKAVSISGQVFNDLNGDGKFEAGDRVMPNLALGLYDQSGTLVASALTDATGSYTFSNVGPGTYTIREGLPAGWLPTVALGPLAVRSGNDITLNIGNFQLVTVSGLVFEDVNGDGVQDPGESGLQGWTVNLLDSNNNVVQTSQTDGTGTFHFVNVTAGTYRVREVAPTGYVQTTTNPADITLTSGLNQAGLNFGMFRTVALRGTVFTDVLGNKTAGAGLAGWTVNLTDTSNAVLASTTTDAQGRYSFTSVGPGTFRLREVLPSGWVQTTDNPADIATQYGVNVSGEDFGNFHSLTINGRAFLDNNGDGILGTGDRIIAGVTVFLDANGNGVLDTGEMRTTTDANGIYQFTNVGPGTFQVVAAVASGLVPTNVVSVTATSGVNVIGQNIGYFRPISVSGQVFQDGNDNGVQDAGESGLTGWTVLLDRTGGPGTGPSELTTTTDASGNFRFSSVGPGTYQVRDVAPAGWMATTPAPAAFTAASGGNVGGLTFGHFLQNTISGQVFVDEGGTGSFAAGDTGLAGWTVYLDANNNAQLDPGERVALTDPAGRYQFTGLGPGTYTVREAVQVGWMQTSTNPPAIVAASGLNTTGVNFGNFLPVSIGGQVFRDINDNGTQDTGEPGLANWTVELDRGSAVVQTTTTDANGNYQFTNLGPGTYSVREHRIAGFAATAPSASGAATVVATSGSGNTTVNFGNTTFDITAVGADAGGGPDVVVFNSRTKAVMFNFFAYAPSFTGGVRVAVGDVNGDGIPDIITAPGAGGGPDIHVYDGRTGALIRQFNAFAPNFTGGSYVAAGDVNGDGFADIIIGADQGGGPNITVFNGRTGKLMMNFFAYAPNFTGGVRVAAGDVNGDGKADIICGAGPSGGPNVTVFSGANGSMLMSFFAYDPRFTAGVYVAAGDVNGDGHADIITGPGLGGGPNVRVFSGVGGQMLADYAAYDLGTQVTLAVGDSIWQSGVRVAAMDFDNNGIADVVTGPGRGRGPLIQVQAPLTATTIDSFFAYSPNYQGGVFIAGGH